ncbi:septum formation family protein [Nocardiopsis sp. N85]|uniref:septum formation family protein n=1 Tax=Nocardiopsis sp. N85 TaxID=3029400 RepID=UPI00237FB8B8|nr:septum formation family protein [Nocardiopsis sp. N85]MDE3719833.1 septum formation family protein [Nocardiopsis sp. N85]
MPSSSTIPRALAVSALACGAVVALSGCGVLDSVLGTQGNVFDLGVGDCFTEEEMNSVLGSEEVSDIPLVDCSEEHDSEIYHVETLPEGDYPGDSVVNTTADETCGTRLAEFVGVAYDDEILSYGVPAGDSTIYYGALLPIESSWDFENGRDITCYAVIVGETVTGTLSGYAG